MRIKVNYSGENKSKKADTHQNTCLIIFLSVHLFLHACDFSIC